MPLIIAPNDRDTWLESNGKEEIQSFFKPFDGLLEAHKVYKVTDDRTGNTNRLDIQNLLE
jgi:hypothetical protein